MIFTVFGSVTGLSAVYWIMYKYNREDRAFSNEELTIMSRKLMNESNDLHRARKTVLSAEELKRLDPTFTAPYIPSAGEPDI